MNVDLLIKGGTILNVAFWDRVTLLCKMAGLWRRQPVI